MAIDSNHRLYLEQFKAMGCPCEIRIACDDPKSAVAICLAEIRRFEGKYSRFLKQSLLSTINQAAGRDWVQIDQETERILDYAGVCHELSQGRFDITSGVLKTVWRDGLNHLPSAQEISAATRLIGWQKVQRKAGAVFLPMPGMQIDLGGVVKEYAADALITLLGQMNVKSGLINLGGDIAVLGPDPDGRPWEIGISDPDRPGQPIAVVHLSDGAITTSGGYERYLEIDGVRYSHLLDPVSGWPVSNLLSVSIIAPQAVVAGSLSTVSLLMPEPEAKSWLAESGAAYLAIDTQRQITGTIRPD